MARFCRAVLLCLISAPAAAQTPTTKGGWTPPRTPWGDPDLQGVYTNIEDQRRRQGPAPRRAIHADGSIEWAVTIDDPSGWTRPWTLAMPLARTDDTKGPLENACHEGNYVTRNILSAARAEERAETK